MKNITIKQYTESQDAGQYDIILSSLKPVNSFAGKQMNVGSMPWANVKYCIRLLNKIESWETVAEIFEICFDVDADVFWKAQITEFYAAKKYLLRAFQSAMETEGKLLAGKSTDAHLWDMAGADRLKPYNDTLPLAQLGKQFGQYPFDLGRKPYSEIINLLAQLKIQNEVESEYQKLKTK